MQESSEAVVVDLGELPVWQGVRDAPAIRCAPFALTLDEHGLVRLRSPETAHQTVAGYGADDYRFPTSPPGSSAWGNALAEKSLTALAALVGRLDGHEVVEIGGGTLYCARQMLERMGARSVTLIDPSVRYEPDTDRLRVRREYFTEQTPVDSRASLIVSFNTLEHVPDPAGFLRAAHRYLADDGQMFLKVPDCEHGFEAGDLGICTHEHLSYFTQASLDQLLEATGFERVAEANYQGALQVLARKSARTGRSVPTQSATLLAQFRRASETHIARFKAFAQRHRGGRAAFVGASVGLSNLLHTTGIAKHVDVEVFDGDALKTGKFMPGLNSPIRLTADPRLESHDVVFITPLNFFDEIRADLARRPGLATARIHAAFSNGDWAGVED